MFILSATGSLCGDDFITPLAFVLCILANRSAQRYERAHIKSQTTHHQATSPSGRSIKPPYFSGAILSAVSASHMNRIVSSHLFNEVLYLSFQRLRSALAFIMLNVWILTLNISHMLIVIRVGLSIRRSNHSHRLRVWIWRVD